jgi:hypothetical protein
MSNGIDFVIGGKDQAGPAMTQVEKSLARLEQKTNSLSSATTRLTQLTGVLVAAYGAIKAATAALGGLDSINAAYDTQADAVRGLNKALELQGESVAEQSAKLQSFAGEMQKLTGVGDEATIAFMRQASMLGVSTDQLETVTKASIGLAEVLGKDLGASLKDLREAQEGNFSAFEKQFPQIKSMASAEEKLAFVSRMAAKGLEAKADASMTVSGMAGRAAGAIGDLMETIGALIAPVRILISQGLKTLAESLQQVLAPAAEYAKDVLENIGPIMDYVKEKVVAGVNAIVAAFTFAEVIVTNLGSVWELLKSGVELRLEQIKNIVMNVFTVVIPSYVEWFGTNFTNILSDAMNLAYTIISNHITKYVDAFKAFWEFLASGGTSDILGQMGEIAGRSYLEGFQSSLTELPQIAERKLSEKEKLLQSKIDGIAGDLGDQFAKKFSERMIRLDDEVGADFNKEINLKLKKEVDDQIGKKLGASPQVSAMESRLLTRGPSDKQQDLIERIVKIVEGIAVSTKESAYAASEATTYLSSIEENTASSTQLVPVI